MSVAEAMQGTAGILLAVALVAMLAGAAVLGGKPQRTPTAQRNGSRIMAIAATSASVAAVLLIVSLWAVVS